MKMPHRTESQVAVAVLRKILHRHRSQGEARLRVLTTIAAEDISKQLGIAMRRELQPDSILLSITRRRLQRLRKAKKFGGTKRRST